MFDYVVFYFYLNNIYSKKKFFEFYNLSLNFKNYYHQLIIELLIGMILIGMILIGIY